MPTPDNLLSYYIDVLGWSEEDASQYHPADLWDMLTPEHKREAKEYSK